MAFFSGKKKVLAWFSAAAFVLLFLTAALHFHGESGASSAKADCGVCRVVSQFHADDLPSLQGPEPLFFEDFSPGFESSVVSLSPYTLPLSRAPPSQG